MSAIVMQLIQFADALERDLAKASRCCAQRSARLQLLREHMRETDWHSFVLRRPDAEDWFDENGVPK